MTVLRKLKLGARPWPVRLAAVMAFAFYTHSGSAAEAVDPILAVTGGCSPKYSRYVTAINHHMQSAIETPLVCNRAVVTQSPDGRVTFRFKNSGAQDRNVAAFVGFGPTGFRLNAVEEGVILLDIDQFTLPDTETFSPAGFGNCKLTFGGGQLLDLWCAAKLLEGTLIRSMTVTFDIVPGASDVPPAAGAPRVPIKGHP